MFRQRKEERRNLHLFQTGTSSRLGLIKMDHHHSGNGRNSQQWTAQQKHHWSWPYVNLRQKCRSCRFGVVLRGRPDVVLCKTTLGQDGVFSREPLVTHYPAVLQKHRTLSFYTPQAGVDCSMMHTSTKLGFYHSMWNYTSAFLRQHATRRTAKMGVNTGFGRNAVSKTCKVCVLAWICADLGYNGTAKNVEVRNIT